MTGFISAREKAYLFSSKKALATCISTEQGIKGFRVRTGQLSSVCTLFERVGVKSLPFCPLTFVKCESCWSNQILFFLFFWGG